MGRGLVLSKVSEFQHKLSGGIKRHFRLSNTISTSSKRSLKVKQLFSKNVKVPGLQLLMIAIAALASGCSDSGGGGGGGQQKLVTYKSHAFYIGCANQAACSQYRLYQLTEGETVPKKIGDLDTINATVLANTDSGSGNIAVVNNKVYYAGTKASTNGVFVFDPTQPEAAGTNPSMITLTSSPYMLTSIGNILYFIAQDNVAGYEIHQFDTSQAVSSTNPKVAFEITVGSGDSDPDWLKAIDGKLYFAARGPSGLEPYVYDPSVAASSSNPQLIYDIMPTGPGNSSSPQEFVGLNGKIFFRAYRAAEGDELWMYDPTQASSSTNPLVIDVDPGSNNSLPSLMTAVNGKLYFRARLNSTGSHNQLFVLDPSQAISATNPSVTYDMLGSTGNESVNRLVNLGRYIFFEAADMTGATGLYFFDTSLPGSSTNPKEVTDLYPVNPLNPRYARVFGDTLLFTGFDDSGYRYLFTVNASTPETMVKIPESNPTGLGDSVYDLIEWKEAQYL